MAFSSTYLAANRTVQVSPTINFQGLTVASGRDHQFPADAARTRMCTVVSGKLKVRVGEAEFLVGSQGVFQVAPGTGCAIANRGYVDVVLHVTTVDM